MPAGKIIDQVLFEPTYECNLRCKYCYLGNKRTKRINTDYSYAIQAARELVDKIKAEGRLVHNVLYHGAETTMLPPEVFGQIINIFHEVDHERHAQTIQTNGTLVNGDYISRLESVVDGDVRVTFCISIDGTKEMTDKHRGRGVYDRAMTNAKMLRGRGYKTVLFGCLTPDKMDKLPELESWILEQRENGLLWAFQVGSEPYDLSDDQQVRLAHWLFERGWQTLYNNIFPHMCSSSGNGCQTLHFSANGDFPPCSRESSVASAPSWKPISFSAAIESRKGHFAGTPFADKCTYCSVRPICNSGCPVFRTARGVANDCMLRRTIYELEAKKRNVPVQVVLSLYKSPTTDWLTIDLPPSFSEVIAGNQGRR